MALKLTTTTEILNKLFMGIYDKCIEITDTGNYDSGILDIQDKALEGIKLTKEDKRPDASTKPNTNIKLNDMTPKVITTIEKDINGHHVKFTIGNQTFKTVTFVSKISEKQANQYRVELLSALDGLIGQPLVTSAEKMKAEKSLRVYIDNSKHKILGDGSDKNMMHGWVDQIMGQCVDNKLDKVVVLIVDNMLFINNMICTLDTKEVRSKIEGIVLDMVEHNTNWFNLPDEFTYELIEANGYKIAKIVLKS